MPTPATTPRVKPQAGQRKRMNRSDREKMIVAEAISFFAEHGFEGNTRDLAKRIGITQPLLYRYFPSKESLIERVYQEVFVSRWKTEWEDLIADRDRPLNQRLTQFYIEYADAIYDYVWVRIFIQSGLKGMDITERYLAIIREKVLAPIAIELRHDAGANTADDIEPSEEEIELVWGLHGMFFYRAIRRFVYNMPITTDPRAAIANDVTAFTASASGVTATIIDKHRE